MNFPFHWAGGALFVGALAHVKATDTHDPWFMALTALGAVLSVYASLRDGGLK